ncbi:hypothetical protein HJG60_012080 [Phyllostomus discolor]|uniref:Uncharacterized protein n=1 Tax=Phyllostomus discolor TaxID=89673 RepID=A0A833ZLI5_9CHIR|nr:hypothetical protein HJG60_012080 [Phyllostomus discolor]
MNSLSDASANMFSLSVGFLFILMSSFAVLIKLCSVMSHLFIFSFVSLAWGDLANKILLRAVSEILLPVFSSNIFMVSGLTFKSVIHFELILVCVVSFFCTCLSNFPTIVVFLFCFLDFIVVFLCFCFFRGSFLLNNYFP